MDATNLATEVLVHDDALRFLHALVDAQALEAGALLDVLEKPWKWQREWQLWHDHDAPSDGDATFEPWIAAVDASAT